ncbi:MAG: hypothetical protein KDD14_20575 [Saprospiraceae bacterium]|nr:hypothetical protein [Saprospiraceae bacterium]
MEKKLSSPYIYLRSLRHAEHTVFSVQEGQKFYYDPQFGNRMAYSSGQQVKRSVMEELTNYLGVPHAPITFNWEIDKGKAAQKEPHSPCDPSYVDQLLGGYMKAESGDYTIKRRSPLSISAMRPLHPKLGGLEGIKENLTFDRTSHPEGHIVKVSSLEGGKRVELSREALDEWLTSNKRNLPNRIWIPDHTRASGLFVFDVAIDLRTLFCVSLNRLEPELHPEIENKLREAGWKEGKNAFGSCLICPKEKRDEIIPALAHALLNWRITSNQSRTFSLMETLAVAVSDNANQIAYAIRGELREDIGGDQPQAVPKLDETAKAEFFVTPVCNGYITGAIGSADALDKAEASLIEKMKAFDFENQVG